MDFRTKGKRETDYYNLNTDDEDGDENEDIEEEPLPDEDEPLPDEEKEDDLFNDGFNDDGFDGMDGGYSQAPMDRHYPDLLKGLTNFSKYIRRLYNNWTGTTWDEETKTFKPDSALQPIMTIIGANWCVSFIETYVRDNNVLAHLSLEEYNSLLMDINRTLLLSLGTRYKEFGYNCYSDVIRVWNEVENASLLALSGAGGGKTMNFLGGPQGGVMSYQSHDQPMMGMDPRLGLRQPQKQGWTSRLGNWLKGNQGRGY